MRAHLILVAVLSACSATGPDPTEDGEQDAGYTPRNAVSGTVGGVALEVRDARLYDGIAQLSSGQQVTVPVIELTNAAALCPNGKFANTKNAVTLRMGLVRAMAVTHVTPLQPGPYAIQDTSCMDTGSCQFAATAMAARWSDSCGGGHPSGLDGPALMATSGTIMVDTMEADRITGRFDLLFGADHLTGTFVAPTCADTTEAFSTCLDP